MRKFISFLTITVIFGFIIILIIELLIAVFKPDIEEKQQTEHYTEQELIEYEKLVEL